eukprot:jgi/Tetstr1/447402/TSEL_034838.t1
MNNHDAPLDPDAPPPSATSIKCEGHLRPSVAPQGYMDYAVNARQKLLQRWLKDTMAQLVRKLHSTRLSDAADGAAGVLNREPRRNRWLKLHQKRGWGFLHLPFFRRIAGGFNIPAGERGLENARLNPSGDMHLNGLPITQLHEVITVGIGKYPGELHKLAIPLNTFSIAPAMGDDGKMTPWTSAMHPSDLEADPADKNRWPHILLYKRYLPYNETARRAREEEMEALQRDMSVLKYKYNFEMAYRMVRAPGRLEMYARENSYDLTHDARFKGIDFVEGWPHAMESVDQLPAMFSTQREWRDWVKHIYSEQ